MMGLVPDTPIEQVAPHSEGLDMPRPGETVGRYRLERELGRGGMGVVFAAHDPRLDRPVAIKVLRRTDREDTRLRREARVLARLDHPNIVAVYDVGRWGSQTFVTMALVEGRDLRTWLQTRQRQPSDVLAAFTQAGRALQAAHDAGVIHRDFKLSNAMMTDAGHVVVLDFGLAYEWQTAALIRTPDELDSAEPDGFASLLTRTGTGWVLGTPAYMSPEQHQGSTVDAASDQYSYCVALHEALFGRRPFNGNKRELLAAKLEGFGSDHVLPETRPPLPREFERALLRGLNPTPGERWPSMANLLEALQPSRPRRALRWTLGGAAVATVAGLVVSSTPDPCASIPARVASRWGSPIRNEITDAFAGQPDRGALMANLDRLDDWHRIWGVVRADACRARQRAAPDDLVDADREIDCLERQWHDAAAVIEALRTGSRYALERATDHTWATPEDCRTSDDDALGPTPPPPSLRAAVAKIRGRLAEARAKHLSGLPGSIREAASTTADAEVLGYMPLVADAHALHASTLERVGRVDEAEASWEAAYLVATECGHLERAARAAIRLVDITADIQQRPTDALEWAGHARSAVQRFGDPAHLQADLLAATAYARVADGDFQGAERDARASLALAPDTPVGWRATAHAGQALSIVLMRAGRPSEARAVAEDAVAFVEEHFGVTDRSTMVALATLGSVWVELREWERALPPLLEADKLDRATAVANSESRATLQANLGLVYSGLGRVDEAEAALLQAIELRERAVGTNHVKLVPTLSNLGTLYQKQERLERAAAVYERATQIMESHPELSPLLLVIVRINQSAVALDRGENDNARRLATTARDVVAETMGQSHPYLGFPLTIIGRTFNRQRRYDEALAPLERALELRDQEPANDPSDETRLALADALFHSGRDPERARALTQQVADGGRRDATTASDLLRERWPDAALP